MDVEQLLILAAAFRLLWITITLRRNPTTRVAGMDEEMIWIAGAGKAFLDSIPAEQETGPRATGNVAGQPASS
jgi:hypothetical protein